jgi:hypothetical protein
MKRPDNWKLDEPISRRRLLEIGAITTAALLIPGAALAGEIAMSKGLLQAAKDVINDFNNFDYAHLEGRMNPNVILKKILHEGSKNGFTEAKDYLDHYMKPRQPQLKNPDGSVWDGTTLTLITPNPENETYARVSGKGLYIDDNGNSKNKIDFTLDFVRNSASDDWSLINCFGVKS